MHYINRLLFSGMLLFSGVAYAQYNPLWIPDTLSGKTFELNIRDTFRQIIPGNQTITGAVNGNFWGPTLIFRKGDSVHLNVHNYLNDSTTLHWHGMHLPAVMDGGPHQVLPPGTLWQPFWKVTNNAGTYWYHPHLHEMTQEQIMKGVGGLILVRDAVEDALPLPRKYGVDDIPVVLTDRSFNAANQFLSVPYGDSMLVNGVLRPQHGVPAQVLRLRILDAAIERSYNLGLSDNRTFYVISSDGGLLNAPVAVTRFLISPGERVEILVNCSGQQGTSVDLKAYNASLSAQIPGGESFPGGPFANALGHKDFGILHLNIGAATGGAITSIPSALTTNVFPATSSAVTTRTISISDSAGLPGILGPNAFVLEHRLFDIKYINHRVPLNNTEIWELASTSGLAHPFHIHDVEFYILSIDGAAPPPEMQGWKDVILVKSRQTIRFIARFDDYADALHPFMYHCHIALHEDEGMMGQFVVTAPASIRSYVDQLGWSVYPNPAGNRLYIELDDKTNSAYYMRIMDMAGRTRMMLPQPDLRQGISVEALPPGSYFLQLTDVLHKQMFTKTFVKQ